MPVTHRAMFQASEGAVECAASHLPGLNFERDGVGYWLWGTPLKLSSDPNLWREELRAFTRTANSIIALSHPSLSGLQSWGSVQIIDGNRCDHVLLAEPAIFENIFLPVTLSARGGGPPPRPLVGRIADLAARQPRFERAANLFAECGDDLTKLYMVMELIEKEHGEFPSKKKKALRTAFCKRIQVEEREWEALHRTARPYRHAEPHEDDGPVLTVLQARALIQHALKLWLEREVP